LETFYWFKTCPLCSQGRLFVYKNLNRNVLYLHCEECERGYYDPLKLDVDNSFLTLTEDFEAVKANFEDIRKANWDKLELKQLTE
jgi:hypothetical protein